MAGDSFDDGTFFDDGTGWLDGAGPGVLRHMLRRRWQLNGAAAGVVLTPPLDSYTTGLRGAYSSRKLLTAWGGSGLKVHNGTTTGDIGFSSNDYDPTGLNTLVGSGSGTLDWWHDQSGNTRPMKFTGTTRARCVNAGANVLQNGHLVVETTANNVSVYATDAFAGYTSAPFTAVVVCSLPLTGSAERVIGITNGASSDASSSDRAALILRNDSNGAIATYRNGGYLGTPTAISANTWYAFGIRFDGTNKNFRQGAGTTDTAASSAIFNIDRYIAMGYDASNSQASSGFKLAEMAFWEGDIGNTALVAILAEQRIFWSAA